jgi:hypothetical protein
MCQMNTDQCCIAKMYDNCNLPNGGQINFNGNMGGAFLVTPDGWITVWMNDATHGYAMFNNGERDYEYNVTQVAAAV